VGVSGKLPTMENIRTAEASIDPVIPNPGQPQVSDPPGPELAPQPPQPEIQEPPPAPIEGPQPGIDRPQAPSY
jgi:hypothetical protein